MEKRLKRTLLRVLAEGGVIFLALDFKVITSDYMLASVLLTFHYVMDTLPHYARLPQSRHSRANGNPEMRQNKKKTLDSCFRRNDKLSW